ncbi:MAG TPA: hypothetical protein IGR64_16435 [Leptolyngbyaceae cyanobacterium M65_K2018_010]|nr:hypothetical protein [Leptolyngbyaceae cyanobacterium M65_K2018_010]
MAPPIDEKNLLPPGPGFGVTFLYYFLGTALVTTLLARQTLGVALDTGVPTQLGLLCGGVGGMLGALVNRSRTLVLACPSQKKFQLQLTTLLAEMGYSPALEEAPDGLLVYQRSALGQWLSGKVYVQIEGNRAHIRSRATHLRRLQKRLEQAGIKT